LVRYAAVQKRTVPRVRKETPLLDVIVPDAASAGGRLVSSASPAESGCERSGSEEGERGRRQPPTEVGGGRGSAEADRETGVAGDAWRGRRES
jgi:hypothetical protein